MPLVNIEISQNAKEFVDREVAEGRFENSSVVMEAALEQMMRRQRKESVERKIEQAIDEVERGEFTSWKPGDWKKEGLAYLAVRSPQ